MNYPGGKGGCFRHLINMMGPHNTYIETHLGGGNVLERKRPAARNIGIDVDRSVIAAWRERQLKFKLELMMVDAVEFLQTFAFNGGELVYCDPPYVNSTRKRLNLYAYEYTDAQHSELLDTIVKLPCAVIISGYQSPLYQDVLQHRHGWRCVEFPNTTRRGRVIESAWTNRDPSPVELHDSRYAGSTYRDRERIRRRCDRWSGKFLAMPASERQVILEALLRIASSEMSMSPAND